MLRTLYTENTAEAKARSQSAATPCSVEPPAAQDESPGSDIMLTPYGATKNMNDQLTATKKLYGRPAKPWRLVMHHK